MRPPATLLIVVLFALLTGCGGSGETGTAPEGGGASTPSLRLAWERNRDCRPPREASRWGCSVGSYRCQGVVTGRGRSISCSRPGRSLRFTVPRR